MRFIKHSVMAICAVILFSQCFWKTPYDLSAFAAQFKENEKIVIVANADIQGSLQSPAGVPGALVPLSGTLSMYAETSLERLKNDDIDIKGFNLVFFDVTQKAISGKETSVKTGTLSMFTPTDVKPVTKYNAKSGTIKLNIPVKAHYAQTDEYSQRVEQGGKKTDYALPVTQDGELILNLRLSPNKDKKTSIDLIAVNSFAWIEALARFNLSRFRINLNDTTITAETGDSESVVTKTLCVQPVNIVGVNGMPETGKGPGKGFEIGWNGVEEQWSSKGGIEFDVQGNWNTVNDANFRVLQSTEDARVLRGMVTAERCIPIIFVDQYLITGGGDTDPIGMETAKIVTSDGVGPNNPTHLAHEMGHVLGLNHSEFFTLMCASGDDDNPRMNSWEHINSARNVLISFHFRDGPLRRVNPDCNLSSECGNGSCPF